MTGATMCSGIGAPETALLGVQWLWSAEVEKFPSRVLAHRHPESMNLGDITAADFIDKARAFGHLNLLVAGTPCQAFSVAGNRRSLEDARGNLTLRFVEVVDAIEPDAIFWENVPGVLSTKDNAFGCFLAALVGADDAIVPVGGWTNAGMVSGPRRNAAWRVLDAQYFGLAQRRKRVFVVACPRNGADPREILFECEGVPRHSPPRREAGKRVAADVAERAGIGFEVGPGGGRDVDVACTMDARAKDGAIRNQVGMLAMSPIGLDEEQNATIDFFGTLKARMEGGGFEGAGCIPNQVTVGTFNNTGQGWWNESETASGLRDMSAGSGSKEATVIAIPILEPGARTGVSTDDVRCSDGIGQPGDPCHPLVAGEPPLLVSTAETSHCLNAGGMGRIDYETETLVAHTLKKRYDSSEDGTGRGIPLVAMAHGIDYETETLVAHSLAIRGRDGVPQIEMGDDCANAILTPNGGRGGVGVGAVMTFQSKASASQSMNPGDISPSMDIGKSDGISVVGAFGVRRLTPVECERLQGFPDVRKTVIIEVCSGSQKNDVSAGLLSHKSPNAVGLAGEKQLTKSASSAEIHSHASPLKTSKPAAVRVEINCGDGTMLLAIQRSGWSESARIAERDSMTFLPTPHGDFARLVALLLLIAGRTAQVGRAESHLGIRRSSAPENGNFVVSLSGEEIEAVAAGVASAINTAKDCLRSTTSEVGPNSLISGLTERTLSCCVLSAIASFIPRGILNGSSFAIELSSVTPYTALDKAADGPRYKALGNSMAVPCIAFIGKRILAALERKNGNGSRS